MSQSSIEEAWCKNSRTLNRRLNKGVPTNATPAWPAFHLVETHPCTSLHKERLLLSMLPNRRNRRVIARLRALEKKGLCKISFSEEKCRLFPGHVTLRYCIVAPNDVDALVRKQAYKARLHWLRLCCFIVCLKSKIGRQKENTIVPT